MKRNFVIAPRDGDRERERERNARSFAVFYSFSSVLSASYFASLCVIDSYTWRIAFHFLSYALYTTLFSMNLTIDRLPGESRPARRPLSFEARWKSVEYGLEEEASNLPESTIEYRFPVWRCCLKILEHHVSLKTLSFSILRAQLFQR